MEKITNNGEEFITSATDSWFKIYTGPMFVGKTKQLIKMARNTEGSVILKHCADFRYEGAIKLRLKNDSVRMFSWGLNENVSSLEFSLPHPFKIVLKDRDFSSEEEEREGENVCFVSESGLLSHGGLFSKALEVSKLSKEFARVLMGSKSDTGTQLLGCIGKIGRITCNGAIERVPYRVKHVCIDEAQFFESDLASFIETLFFGKNFVNITVSGLVGDSTQRAFGNIRDVMNFATDVVFLKGTCAICAKPKSSCYSMRYEHVDKSSIAIGGEEKYYSVCSTCYVIIRKK